MSAVCYVFGAGEYLGEVPKISPGDFCIAADGGLSHAESFGIVPDVILGDFDSLGCVPHGDNVIKYAAEKDDTDMALALRFGREHGCSVFHIYGGTGGRPDHTLANIQLLAYLSRDGARGYLHGKDCCITAVTDGVISFDEQCTGTVSVFAHGDTATGVYERGLKYSLDNATLTNDNPLGVSNEFCGRKSSVEVKSGTLIVMCIM